LPRKGGAILFEITVVKKFTLKKEERLKRRKIIEQLFSEGKSVAVFPVRAQYKLYSNELATPLQAGFSASSRNFKKAVDRNRIKRLMREAYRLQKIPLQEALHANNRQLALFFIYTGKELPDYKTVSDRIGVILNKLVALLN
jgi:ribonuclease P protein component